MSFSSGKNAFFISDRSGLKFPYRHKVREWNGSIVAKSEYERKHPQLDPRPKKADAQAAKLARQPREKQVQALARKLANVSKLPEDKLDELIALMSG